MLNLTDLPEEWTFVATIAIGGLTEIGFASEGDAHLLVVSSQGRGLFITQTGSKVARDRRRPTAGASWIDERNHTVEGFGPLGGVTIPCVGLWGGKLPERAEGWTVSVDSRRGSEEVVLNEERTKESWLLQAPITELRAFGFSPSARFIAVATSSDVELYRRVTRTRSSSF